MGRDGLYHVHQGTIARDTSLFVADSKKPIKAGHIYRPMGKQYLETDRGIPGDICAQSKLEGIHLNAILHNSHDEDYMRLESTRLPSSMVGLAIEPKTRGDEQKLADALDKLTAEDPCLVIERNSDAHETVLRGLGEVHLRVALGRIRDRHHVEVNTRPPSVSYRETATRAAEGHHRHKKQTGGAGQFGEVFLRVEPLERGAGFEFVDRIVGASIPGHFVPAVEKGVRQALAAGTVAGYPIQDVRVVVHGGKHHPVDSQEISFVIAGRKAFLDAMKNAASLLLEPIVNIEVVTPSGHVGDIVGDLSSRRGRITDTQATSGSTTVIAQVPMAELSDYAARLTSMTAGEGSYSVEFNHYEPAPHHIQQKLAQQFRPKEEAQLVLGRPFHGTSAARTLSRKPMRPKPPRGLVAATLVVCSGCGSTANLVIGSQAEVQVEAGGPQPSCGDGGSRDDVEPPADGGCSNLALCAVLKTALVHRYSFNGMGAVATDSVGSAHGTVVNAQLHGDGTLFLAGQQTDQYVDCRTGIIRHRSTPR